MGGSGSGDHVLQRSCVRELNRCLIPVILHSNDCALLKGENAHKETGLELISNERRAEFEQNLESVRARLLRFVISLVASSQDAEDIVQRASVAMWRRFSTFETGTDFLAWAYAFAAFETKNFARSSGRSVVLFDETLFDKISADRQADLQNHNARLEALEECVKGLDPESQTLLEAVYARGEHIKDLAHREGRAPQTFYNRLNFLRRALTECMQNKLNPAKP